ncbi:LysM peptidoglycan-binding domain-containing protein [Halovulum marinum]|nr:LysM peptidoglycan-binding domain-containing protein [Halovulum marinum]
MATGRPDRWARAAVPLLLLAAFGGAAWLLQPDAGPEAPQTAEAPVAHDPMAPPVEALAAPVVDAAPAGTAADPAAADVDGARTADAPAASPAAPASPAAADPAMIESETASIAPPANQPRANQPPAPDAAEAPAARIVAASEAPAASPVAAVPAAPEPIQKPVPEPTPPDPASAATASPPAAAPARNVAAAPVPAVPAQDEAATAEAAAMPSGAAPAAETGAAPAAESGAVPAAETGAVPAAETGAAPAATAAVAVPAAQDSRPASAVAAVPADDPAAAAPVAAQPGAAGDAADMPEDAPVVAADRAEDATVVAPAPSASATAPQGAAGPEPSAGDEVTLSASLDPRPETDPARPSLPPEKVSAAPPAPSFDLIRIDAGGGGVVAGRAQPGAVVQVMAGDLTLATVEASARGEFVAFVQTPDSDEGQVLSLIARTGQAAAEGTEDVLVLPSAAPDADPAPPTVVRAGEEAVRVVQPSALGKVDGVTLDAISYDEAGEVRLSGRAPGAQPIRIYLDGAAVGTARSSDAGVWDARVEGIDAGRYVLRVDALTADGGVASRAESPFQRVYPSAQQRANPGQVTVQPGNNLWLLARARYGQGILYTQIFAANRDAIRDPDLIYPGQIFALPDESEFAR